MERRKKGSGQVTHVPGRKSPWRACVVDSTGKQKSRFFKTEKEANHGKKNGKKCPLPCHDLLPLSQLRLHL